MEFFISVSDIARATYHKSPAMSIYMMHLRGMGNRICPEVEKEYITRWCRVIVGALDFLVPA